MNKKLKSPVGLNAGGIGPKIFRNTMPFLVIAILLGIFFPSVFAFTIVAKNSLKYAGWIILALGISTYITTMVQFLRNFSKGILITNGIFAFSRNPLYASWILFVLPGIAFVSNNWSFLFSSIALYLFFIKNIKEEEHSLQIIFGEQYTAYCNRVGRICLSHLFKKSETNQKF